MQVADQAVNVLLCRGKSRVNQIINGLDFFRDTDGENDDEHCGGECNSDFQGEHDRDRPPLTCNRPPRMKLVEYCKNDA